MVAAEKRRGCTEKLRGSALHGASKVDGALREGPTPGTNTCGIKYQWWGPVQACERARQPRLARTRGSLGLARRGGQGQSGSGHYETCCAMFKQGCPVDSGRRHTLRTGHERTGRLVWVWPRGGSHGKRGSRGWRQPRYHCLSRSRGTAHLGRPTENQQGAWRRGWGAHTGGVTRAACEHAGRWLGCHRDTRGAKGRHRGPKDKRGAVLESTAGQVYRHLWCGADHVAPGGTRTESWGTCNCLLLDDYRCELKSVARTPAHSD